MIDQRVAKWADVLVRYSNNIQPGEWAVIQGPLVAQPLIQEIYRAVLRAGGHPTVLFNPGLNEVLYKEANDEQLDWVSPVSKLTMEQANALFSVWGEDNTRALTNVDASRMARAQGAGRELLKTMMQRIADKSLKWVGTMYPTQGHAQEASMSLAEYEEFVLGAMLLNEPDPVAA